jgi:hypothetical protein
MLTITVQTFFWFVDIGRIAYHHCSPKETFDSDGQQFYQYQQNKTKI